MNFTSPNPIDNNSPLAASQFSVPAFTRFTILENVNRTNGEYLAQLSGDYLRVETVDLPARISFNNNDFIQSVPLIPGTIIEGNFSGVTLWHDDYVNMGVAGAAIVFDVGRGGKISQDNLNGLTAVPLPFLQLAFTVAQLQLRIPVPYGYKRLKICGTVAWATPLTQAIFQELRFYDKNLVQIFPGALTRNSIVYNTANAANTPHVYKGVSDYQTIGATVYANIDMKDVPIPSNAESAVLTVQTGATAGAINYGMAAHAY